MMWLRLSWRNVWANGRRSALVLLTVLLAGLSLMLFAGYVKATKTGLEYSTIRGGVGHLQISGKGGFDGYSEEPLAFGLAPAQVEAIEAAADKQPEVRRVVPRLQFAGLVSNGARTLSFSGTGVDPILENAAFGARQRIAGGEALRSDSPSDGVLLGAELARRLNVRPGGSVTVMTTTVSGAINAIDMVVVGLVSTGVPQTELYLLQAKLDTVQELLGTDKVSNVAVLLEDGSDVEVATRRFEAAVPGLELRNWRQLSPAYDQVVGLYTTLFTIFGGFIIVVTTFSVATTVLTSVLERTREIGVMRSLGISPASVRRAFLLEGVILCTVALVLAAIAALLLGQAINAADLTAPPPPGRTVGYPFRIFWDGPAVIEIALVITLLT
ncbi:MAG TPA: FtsX-like permease family protein, partial [Allosphingosinicella sp.]